MLRRVLREILECLSRPPPPEKVADSFEIILMHIFLWGTPLRNQGGALGGPFSALSHKIFANSRRCFMIAALFSVVKRRWR